MGRVGFQYADEWGGVQIGWAIAPQFWGQGHATQASRQAIDWLFSERDIQKLLCLVLPENTRSIAMAARLGMGYSHDMSYQGKKVYVYSLNAPGGA